MYICIYRRTPKLGFVRHLLVAMGQNDLSPAKKWMVLYVVTLKMCEKTCATPDSYSTIYTFIGFLRVYGGFL